MKKPRKAVLASLVALAFPAAADIAVSANDNKPYLDNGVVKTHANPAPDNALILDLSVTPARVIAQVDVPASVVGPPVSVAVSRDESFAIVTCATKVDPADPTKVVPDNRVSVIDLKANPPRVLATVEAGAGAAGVSLNREGTLALVANRNEGTVSVITVKDKALTHIGKIKLGDEKSGPSHVAITPDGKRAIVTRDGDHTLSILNIDGTQVTDAKRDFGASYRPYGVDITPDGAWAVVGNVGRGAGDADIVSLVDLKANPPRVVDTVSTGAQTAEGITLSPDGKHAVAIMQDGSNKPKSSPFYRPNGKAVLLRLDGGTISRVGEAAIGGWSQGSAFSRDGKTLYVQNMVEKEIWVLKLDGDRLTDTGQRIKVNGGPAGMRTSW